MAPAGSFKPLEQLASRLGRYKKPAVQVRGATERVLAGDVERFLAGLGDAEEPARRLDAAVDAALDSVLSLSLLTAPLALDYLERLARPIPALTPEIGVQIVSRSYVAHLVVEEDPSGFGAVDVPVLGTLPPLRRGGSPPQDLLTRVVKASRRNFELIRAVSTPVWDGFVRSLTRRAHDQAAGAGGDFLSIEVVDGLARFGWVLRQVDLHYGQAPERR